MSFDCLTTEGLRLLLVNSKERITRIKEELDKRKEKTPTGNGWYWCIDGLPHYWHATNKTWHNLNFGAVSGFNILSKPIERCCAAQNKDGSFQHILQPRKF